jgi:hypothetical protein
MIQASDQRRGIAAALSALAVGCSRTAQAAETVKPLQAISFHAGSKDAVAYFITEGRTCKLALTMADSAGQPTRFEAAITGGESTRYQLAEGQSLEFACQADAQAMAINSLTTVAAGR